MALRRATTPASPLSASQEGGHVPRARLPSPRTGDGDRQPPTAVREKVLLPGSGTKTNKDESNSPWTATCLQNEGRLRPGGGRICKDSRRWLGEPHRAYLAWRCSEARGHRSAVDGCRTAGSLARPSPGRPLVRGQSLARGNARVVRNVCLLVGPRVSKNKLYAKTIFLELSS